MKVFEKTCKCIEDLITDNYHFHKGREYQVDIYPLFYKIYQNGGWDDYIYIEDTEEFNKYFKEIN